MTDPNLFAQNAGVDFVQDIVFVWQIPWMERLPANRGIGYKKSSPVYKIVKLPNLQRLMMGESNRESTIA